MNRLLLVFAVLALAGCAGLGGRQIQEDSVTYYDGTTVMKGYIVYDASIQAKRPGVVVIHEWWGITQHTRNEARNLARQGYTAIVADMFGEGQTADNPKSAGALSARCERIPRRWFRASTLRATRSPGTPRSTRAASRPSASASAARWCSTWRARALTCAASPPFTPACRRAARRRRPEK